MDYCKVCEAEIGTGESYCGDYICQTVKTREELRSVKGILGEISQLWANTKLEELFASIGKEQFDLNVLKASLEHFIYEKLDTDAMRRFLLAMDSIKSF